MGSSLVSSWRMAVLSPTTTSRRSLPFISSSGSGEEPRRGRRRITPPPRRSSTEEEGQAPCAEVLQGRRQRQDQPSKARVSRRGVWCRHLHGCHVRSPVLWQVRPHLCLQQARG